MNPLVILALLIATSAFGQDRIARTNDVGQWEVRDDLSFAGTKGWKLYVLTNQPAFNPATQRVFEAPALLVEPNYYQQWVVRGTNAVEFKAYLKGIAISRWLNARGADTWPGLTAEWKADRIADVIDALLEIGLVPPASTPPAPPPAPVPSARSVPAVETETPAPSPRLSPSTSERLKALRERRNQEKVP